MDHFNQKERGTKTGRELKAEMVLAGVTIKKIIETLNLSRVHVSNILNEKANLTLENQKKIEEVINNEKEKNND